MDSREPRTAAGQKYESNGVSREYVLTIERQAAEQALRASGEREAETERIKASLDRRATSEREVALREALAELVRVQDKGNATEPGERHPFFVQHNYEYGQMWLAAWENARALLATDPASPSPAAQGIEVERLARAIEQVDAEYWSALEPHPDHIGCLIRPESLRQAERIVAEYARLASSGASTDQKPQPQQLT